MEYCIAPAYLQRHIKTALRDFKRVWKSDSAIYEEFCFCLLTPQSSAKQAMKCINDLKRHKLLDKGKASQKEKYVRKVRFFRTKAKRLEEAQKKFPRSRIKSILKKEGLPNNPIKTREFLVREVNGYGMKESSHFLRNIGFGKEIAILDRHILKNLKTCGIIKEVPATISSEKYLDIEEKMHNFCKKNKIDFAELDLIFWSNETGEILK